MTTFYYLSFKNKSKGDDPKTKKEEEEIKGPGQPSAPLELKHKKYYVYEHFKVCAGLSLSVRERGKEY